MIVLEATMLERILTFTGRRLASPGCWLIVNVGGLLAGGSLCLLAQTSRTTQLVDSVMTAKTFGQPSATPAQTNGVDQTTSGTTNNLSQTIVNDPAFQRFTNLVAHSLFTPTSASSTGASDTGVPAFAADLRLTGIFKFGDVIQVSIESRSEPDKKLFVRVGEMIGDTGIKIVSVDFPGRAVVLAKGEEQGRLEYESEAAPAPPQQVAGAQKPGTPAMMPPGGPPGGPPGPRGGLNQPPPPQGTSGTDGNSMRTTRAQNRRQTIDRLRQMLQNTTDPAAQQRLKSYIQLLEKANSEER